MKTEFPETPPSQLNLETAQRHFAARYFFPVPGYPGPGEEHRIIYAKSAAAARRAAKALAVDNGWRLVEIFELAPEDRERFRSAGWYSKTLFAH